VNLLALVKKGFKVAVTFAVGPKPPAPPPETK
jgi:hypothetical protein